jgi:ABC-type bacteriocin/lantibiotic exporter with double-glycine peptidase domain
VLEVFGLLMIVPVVEIILVPGKVESSPYLMSLYKALGVNNKVTFIMILLGTLVGFFLIKNVLVYFASRQQTTISFNISAKLANMQFERFLYQPFEHHVGDNNALLLRKIVDIPFTFTLSTLLPVISMVNELIIAFIILVGIGFYNPQLFVSMVLFISPFLIIYIKIYKKSLSIASNDRDIGHADMFRKGRQSLDGFREIKVFDKFQFFIPDFTKSIDRYSRAMSGVYLLNAFSPKIIEMLAVLCVFGIFVVGVFLSYDLTRMATFLAAFSIAAYRLIPSINKIILSYNSIRSTEYVFRHFDNDLKNYKVGANAQPTESVMPLDFNERIDLKNIHFGYNGKPSLLQGISFSITKGEIIGLIGKSGSGKTTLINIMMGLLAPSQGSIRVDDIDLDPAKIRRWHKTISFVPQSPTLIEGSIRENIAFGIQPEQIDSDLLEKSIINSGLTEFIAGLPEGLETRIADKTLNISGGQKQRIAIARALYHNGSILIFDEPTSALDNETERKLTESIKHLGECGYTTIIIAHRVETLRYCTRIYRIEEGQAGEPLQFQDLHVSVNK